MKAKTQVISLKDTRLYSGTLSPMAMRKATGIWIVLASVMAAASATIPARAQEAGDAGRGLQLATRVCAACHAVRKREDSPNPLAPAFDDIAAVKGMSAMALTVALQTPHSTMPNLVLQPDERVDIVAYILSLKAD